MTFAALAREGRGGRTLRHQTIMGALRDNRPCIGREFPCRLRMRLPAFTIDA